MAERRMFAKSIIDSDEFLDMPASAQNLYFHLGMRADDEGFLNNWKRIIRDVRASDDDFKVLAAKKYVLMFDSGIIVLRHWRIHNYLRSDRFKGTIFTAEKAQLQENEDKSYDMLEAGLFSGADAIGIPTVHQLDTQYSIGKDRLAKDSLELEDSVKGDDTCNASLPPVLYNFPKVGGKTEPLTEDFIELLKSTYPKLDVMEEIKKADLWCQTNNYKSNIKKFLTSWMNRANDRLRVTPMRGNEQPQRADYTGSWDNQEGETF